MPLTSSSFAAHCASCTRARYSPYENASFEPVSVAYAGPVSASVPSAGSPWTRSSATWPSSAASFAAPNVTPPPFSENA